MTLRREEEGFPNRFTSKRDRSNDGDSPRLSGTITSPRRLANLNPWPEQALTTTTFGCRGWGPMRKFRSGAFVYKQETEAVSCGATPRRD